MLRIERVSNKVSLKRSIDNGTEEQQNVVLSILSDVKANGDTALTFYTEKFDGVTLSNFKVGTDEIKEAYANIDESLVQIIQQAAGNIRDFHSRQVRQSWMDMKIDGTIVGQKITPLDAVGVYVPGGTAAYPSSVLMNVIPAKVAGVERIVMVTPPDMNGKVSAGVLVAADIVGVDEIYKVGGAQAIGALAYGTETIDAVDKIVGPGNIYVALAKREVFGNVAIDMIAGPSEIVVLADESALPNEVAADLLSQAEHDERASSILVTNSYRLAEKVAQEVDRQLQLLPRRGIAEVSIAEYGAIYVTEDIEESIRVVNELAPEHLEILTEEPMELVGKIKHAGAIFVGRYSTEPIGDYFAGPNHVLPTNGTARFSGPLEVDDFTKKSSIISYSRKALMENGTKIAEFARLEGLEAHAKAIEERLKD